MTGESFEYFYKKYLKPIVKYVIVHYKIDLEAAKDIAQDVFRILWENREMINDENEIKIFKWLCETARRKSLEYNRSHNKTNVDYYSDPEEMSNNFSAEYEDLIHNEGFKSAEEKYQNYLSEIKKNLDEKESKLFTLVVEKKIDAKKAAALLEISDVNFRVRWCRLRIKLRPIVKKIIEK